MKAARAAKRASGSNVWRASELTRYDGALLLDTHVWIWHVEGNASQLDAATIALLDRSSAVSRLLVSDISYWEVAVKTAKGKLTLSIDVAVWLQRAEAAPGVRFLPLDRAVLLQSTLLVGAAHNDPADRMLMATAQIHNVPLVTADGAIIEYANAHPGTPVVDARPKRK